MKYSCPRKFADGRLTRPELVAEVEWLLGGGMHPRLIAQELHMSLDLLSGAARRQGNQHVATLFNRCITEDKRERKAA